MTGATHKTKILSWLKRGQQLTPIDALDEFGCFRLAARIYDLREDGYDIRTDVSEGYARYWMEKAA